MVFSEKYVVVRGLMISVVICCMVLMMSTQGDAQSLLSQGKPSFASSHNPNFPPSMANDGDWLTGGSGENKWVTLTNPVEPPPHWWYVDLQAQYRVTSARILGLGINIYSSPQWNVRRVGIYGSNTAAGTDNIPANWTRLAEFDFFSGNAPFENLIDFCGVFRYVAFYIYRPVCADINIVQIKQIQVYGDTGTVCGPVDPPARGSAKPTDISVSPSSGTWQVGTSEAFTFHITDADGCLNMRYFSFGIGDDFGKQGMRLFAGVVTPFAMNEVSREIALFDGSSWIRRVAFPGSTNPETDEVIMVNSGCQVACDGNTISIRLEFMLKPNYSDLGEKNIYVQVIDRALESADLTCNIITKKVGTIHIVDPAEQTPVPTPALWHHFAWDDIPPPVQSGVPIPVRITARDYNHTPVPYYDDTLELKGCTGVGLPRTLGSDPAQTSPFMLNTEFTRYRHQTIYHASQIGQPGEISRLGLVMTKVPYTRMFNFTVRMRHTDMDHYPNDPVWETDWTTVLQGDIDIMVDIPPGMANWFYLYFQQPFLYNGTDNLMIDVSFSNPSTASPGYNLFNEGDGYRSIYGTSIVPEDGEPTTWAGNVPAPFASRNWPVIRLIICEDVPISPVETGNFQAGVWQGEVTVLGYAPVMHLVSVDPFGFFDRSVPFEVTPNPDYTPPPTNTPGPQSTPTNTPVVVEEIIVDNTDAGFQITGDWTQATMAADKYGADYYWSEVGTGADTASWSINIANPASVQFYAWWSAGGNRATNAPYTITHASRASTTVRVNQQTNGGQWNSLGTFNLNAGPVVVTLSDDADAGAVIADAVRFVVEEAQQPTPTNTPVQANTPTSTPVSGFTCMGDADRNGFVNGEDFRSVRDNFGKGECGVGDANNDCFVNGEDFRAVRDNFGRSCP